MLMYVHHELARSKKRKQSFFELLPEQSGLVVKRERSAPERKAVPGHPPSRYWDTLSKVRLSRGSFREFHRRTQPIVRQWRDISPGLPSLATSNITQLKSFSRHGGPDLNHLRGFANVSHPNDSMTKSGPGSLKRSSSSRSSPYNKDFEQKLIDSHVYPEGYEYSNDETTIVPTNMKFIQREIRVPRPSLSPSRFPDSNFREFKRQAVRAVNETGAMADVIPIIAGEERKKYSSVTDALFNKMTPLLEDVTRPKPDIYDGARPEKIDPDVRHDLAAHIIPCTDTNQPAAPNFFLEGKSSRGRADVAKRQACFDGAVGARAMHSLQNYRARSPKYDENAYTYSSTFHNGTGTLQLYSTHVTRPDVPGGPLQYHMTQIKSFAMTSDIKTFKKGATAFRNVRRLAESQRNALIQRANSKARKTPLIDPTPTSSQGSPSMPYEDGSDTSENSSQSQELIVKRHRPSPSTTSDSRSSSALNKPGSKSRDTGINEHLDASVRRTKSSLDKAR